MEFIFQLEEIDYGLVVILSDNGRLEIELDGEVVEHGLKTVTMESMQKAPVSVQLLFGEHSWWVNIVGDTEFKKFHVYIEGVPFTNLRKPPIEEV